MRLRKRKKRTEHLHCSLSIWGSLGSWISPLRTLLRDLRLEFSAFSLAKQALDLLLTLGTHRNRPPYYSNPGFTSVLVGL